MSSRSLFQVAAAALMVGPVLFVIGFPQARPPDEVAVFPQVLIIAFALLLLVGLVGVYLRQHDQIGVSGLVGAALAFIGTVLLTGFNYFAASAVPVLADVAPEFLETFPEGEWPRLLVVNMVARVGFALGFIILGFATYRAGILPRWAAVVTALGSIGATVVFFLPQPVGLFAVLLLPVGLFGLGWGLWSSSHKTQQPQAIEEWADQPS